MVKWDRRPARGFTLVELLVVITVLGVLAAVVVFAVSGITDKGQSSACATDSRTMRNSEEAYFARNGAYASEAQLVSGGLLQTQSALHDVTLSGGSYFVTSAGACAVTIVSDDFEPPAVTAAPAGHWYTVNAGSTFGPWTVSAGSIDVVSPSFWNLSNAGVNDVDLNGSSYGTIQRSIAGLTVGNTYTLMFSYAVNPGAPSAGARVQIASLDTTLTASNPATSGYQTATYSFTAANATETLKFTGSGPNGSCGVVLDNIIVST
jgi:general secretion pathway protein G